MHGCVHRPLVVTPELIPRGSWFARMRALKSDNPSRFAVRLAFITLEELLLFDPPSFILRAREGLHIAIRWIKGTNKGHGPHATPAYDVHNVGGGLLSPGD